MVDSLDELRSSRSVCGKDFPNFEMLDAKIALCSEQAQKEGQSRGEDQFLRGKTERLHDLRHTFE